MAFADMRIARGNADASAGRRETDAPQRLLNARSIGHVPDMGICLLKQVSYMHTSIDSFLRAPNSIF